MAFVFVLACEGPGTTAVSIGCQAAHGLDCIQAAVDRSHTRWVGDAHDMIGGSLDYQRGRVAVGGANMWRYGTPQGKAWVVDLPAVGGPIDEVSRFQIASDNSVSHLGMFVSFVRNADFLWLGDPTNLPNDGIWGGRAQLVSLPATGPAATQMTLTNDTEDQIYGGLGIAGVVAPSGVGDRELLVVSAASLTPHPSVYVLPAESTGDLSMASVEDVIEVSPLVGSGEDAGIHSMDAGGDLDQDGTPDLILGAPLADTTSPGDHAGVVHVMCGPVNDRQSTDEACLTIAGSEPRAYAGA